MISVNFFSANFRKSESLLVGYSLFLKRLIFGFTYFRQIYYLSTFSRCSILFEYQARFESKEGRFDGKTTSRRAGLHAEPPLCLGPQDCMEASCESAKRDGLRPRVLGNVVKIIIKAVTTPYYLFVRLTRVPATPRTAVQGSLCAPPEVATAPIRLVNITEPCSLISPFRDRSKSVSLVRKASCKGYKCKKA